MYSISEQAPPRQTLDDPFYYLVNFQQVLDWIDARYSDLLSASERAFVATFRETPRASQALLVRMVMRKGTLFRASKLVYDEIGCPLEATAPLVANGWVDAAPELSLDQLFDLLTKPEITAAFKSFIDKPGARKGDTLESLRPLFPESRPLKAWCGRQADRVFALSIMETCDRFRLMFFGNLRQDWSEFVLADLGLYRYEMVEFSRASRAFQSRSDVDDYLHLFACREYFAQRVEQWAGEPTTVADAIAEVLGAIPDTPIENPWIEARRAKLLFQLGQFCERRGELAPALKFYAGCSYPGARVRRIRVLERIGDFQAALDLVEEAGWSPESEAEKQHLLRILPRLRRKLGLARVPAQTPVPVKRLDLVLPLPSGRYAVEQEVRAYFTRADAPVWYVENTLLNALFGLLCWEAIFAPMPGAFFHRFHSGPADLLHPDFYPRRTALFDAYLGQLDAGTYRKTIERNYRDKQGLQSPFVYWDGLHPLLLEQALDCFPAAHLKAWFRRLLEDIKANRAGMPDLVQFWPEEQRYRMIEVKAPGDRLQDNQLRWLDFCAQHGMPVEVCYVRWTTDGVLVDDGLREAPEP